MGISSDKWRVRTSSDTMMSEDVRSIADSAGLFLPTAAILYERGYKTPEAVRRFLSKETEMLHDPFEMKDMREGAERILASVKNHEKTVIYGDYDVDGVTSVCSLYLYLEKLGADIDYYIPQRSSEGYGMSCDRVRALAKEGVSLIITVDTGVTAVEEARVARECGVDLVVTDHHECHDALPDAYAVINPRRDDCPYPFKELAGVGVVFKVLCAMEILRNPEKTPIECILTVCRDYIDLVAIGTVADVMSISDENRLIVAQGLAMLENSPRDAVVQLVRAINSEMKKPQARKITTGYIGYTVAPRINAAGRISSASDAVEMFLSKDSARAAEYAKKLCEINHERQSEENKIAQSASEKVSELGEDLPPVLILDDEGWHHGVIGIVSSRMTEKYHLPSILISFEGNEGEISGEDIGKGSGRSIKGLDLVEALASCSDILEKFGGHELAAGLTVKRKNLPELRRRLEKFARENIPADSLSESLCADLELFPENITVAQAEELILLEPHGSGNPVPLFIMRDLCVADVLSVGEGKHTRVTVNCGERSVTAMCFRRTLEELDLYPGDKVDVAFNLDINEYQGIRTVQMIVREIGPSLESLKLRRRAMAEYDSVVSSLAEGKNCDMGIDRALIGEVYLMIKNELKRKHEVFSIGALLHLARGRGIEIGYIQLKIILDIFSQLELLGIRLPSDEREIYRFHAEITDKKTNLEKSALFRSVMG